MSGPTTDLCGLLLSDLLIFWAALLLGTSCTFGFGLYFSWVIFWAALLLGDFLWTCLLVSCAFDPGDLVDQRLVRLFEGRADVADTGIQDDNVELAAE